MRHSTRAAPAGPALRHQHPATVARRFGSCGGDVKLIIGTELYSHPRTLQAGLAAMGLWIKAGSWLAQFPDQGDFIPEPVIRQLDAASEADALVRAGLWRRGRNGYRMLQYVSPMKGLPPSETPIWSLTRADYRRKIPADIRERVYERDENCCQECGTTENLSLDHIYPWSLGGADSETNLRVLCRSCNSSKGARTQCRG